jgi:GNAT superfamily N-acetyltransferase
MAIRIESYTGDNALPYLEDLARLRIEVFREWPYLYDGNLAYERDYLTTFAGAEDSVIVIAFDGEEVVGASTGLPIIYETPGLKRPFEERGYGLERIFYFSESVLRKSYRGRGIGKAFFREREAWVRQLGKYDWITFCGVVRPQNHPRRPEDYRPLDGFWRKQGYRPTGMTCHIRWRDLDEEEESEKPLRFWIKKLL